MAAALRLLRHRLVAPPSPMLRSLFPASYSKAAAAAADDDDILPAVCRAALTPPPPSLSRQYCRDVFPRKAPPPKDEPGCCTPVPDTVSEGTKSLLDQLKDLKESKMALRVRRKNIMEHRERIRIGCRECRLSSALCKERLALQRKFLAKIREARVSSSRIKAYCSKLDKMGDEYDKDWAIEMSKEDLVDQHIEMVEEEEKDYLNALRRCHELERSIKEKVKKVGKVCGAVGLVGGLLLMLAKM